MFYIVKEQYYGSDERLAKAKDACVIEIRTEPVLSGLNRSPCLDGWCGGAEDRSTIAYGEYDSLNSARAALKQLFGIDANSATAKVDLGGGRGKHVVEAYGPGTLEPLPAHLISGRLSSTSQREIKAALARGATITNARLDEILDDHQAKSASEGYSLDRNRLREAFITFLDEARRDAEDDRRFATHGVIKDGPVSFEVK